MINRDRFLQNLLAILKLIYKQTLGKFIVGFGLTIISGEMWWEPYLKAFLTKRYELTVPDVDPFVTYGVGLFLVLYGTLVHFQDRILDSRQTSSDGNSTRNITVKGDVTKSALVQGDNAKINIK